MITFVEIALSICVLFVGFIALRSFFSLKICALCASVSTTWFVLLVLFFAGMDIDPLLIAILMGGSVVGAMYLLEEKLPESYSVFKLPYYLTGVWVVYSIFHQGGVLFEHILILLAVWLVFVTLFIWKDSEMFRSSVKQVIECCKNW